MISESELLALLLRRAVKSSVISSSAKSPLAFYLEAEHTANQWGSVGHYMQDDTYYLAYYQYLEQTAGVETVRDVEIDLFYKPPGYPGQVIFGRSENVVPEQMPEQITINCGSSDEISKAAFIAEVQKRLNAAAHTLMIDTPENSTGYAKCRIWRVEPLWI